MHKYSYNTLKPSKIFKVMFECVLNGLGPRFLLLPKSQIETGLNNKILSACDDKRISVGIIKQT